MYVHISIHTYSLHVYVDEHNTNEWKSCVRIDNMSYVAPSLKQDWLTQAHLGRWCINYQSIYSIYLFITIHPSTYPLIAIYPSTHPSLVFITLYQYYLCIHQVWLHRQVSWQTIMTSYLCLASRTPRYLSDLPIYLSIYLFICHLQYRDWSYFVNDHHLDHHDHDSLSPALSSYSSPSSLWSFFYLSTTIAEPLSPISMSMSHDHFYPFIHLNIHLSIHPFS